MRLHRVNGYGMMFRIFGLETLGNPQISVHMWNMETIKYFDFVLLPSTQYTVHIWEHKCCIRISIGRVRKLLNPMLRQNDNLTYLFSRRCGWMLDVGCWM